MSSRGPGQTLLIHEHFVVRSTRDRRAQHPATDPQQIRSFLQFLSHPRRAREADASAAREYNWRNQRAELPVGLTLRWLGTSGFELAYQDHRVLIDPYVTRLPVVDVIRRRPAQPSAAAVDRFVPDRVDAILLGHTHFDHAFDAPVIARRDGATVYGSRSAAALMQLYGLADRAVTVAHYQPYDIGPFRVTFVPSVHSKLVLGLHVPMAGDICCAHFDELVPSAYGCGDVYGIHIEVAGTSFYHQGSADLIDDAIVHRGIDYFLAGIAGRGFSERYVDRIVRKLEPRYVVAHHFDDFFRPLDAPMGFSLNVNLAGFADELTRVSREITLLDLEPLQTAGTEPKF